MTIKLNRENAFQVNEKRVLRLMWILHLKSVCRRRRKNYVKSTPEITAENILNREFHAEYFGEKRLTDVTKMKYGINGTVKPLFHSDRGYQYTSKSFRKRLNKAGMTQSMPRVSRCIDNGLMEAFWGMLKSEMYYLRKFQTYEELKEAVSDYIDYYNNHRYQKRLKCMTPIEYRHYLENAA